MKSAASHTPHGDVEKIRRELNRSYDLNPHDPDCAAVLSDARLLLAENERLKKLLHDLTPGGSEFANNPEGCFEWVWSQSHDRAKLLIKTAKERNQLQAERTELVEALSPDAAGRPFSELLREAANQLVQKGDGPIADCLALKAVAVENAEAVLDKVAGKEMKPITEFKGTNRFLLNFWSVIIYFEGEFYPSVEHAYQAAKTVDPEKRKVFQDATVKPGRAKRLGKRLPLRGDWEEVKLGVMYYLVRQKFFTEPILAASLLATGDAELIEGNKWGDTFWGVSGGTGQNNLGKILMQVRAELRLRR